MLQQYIFSLLKGYLNEYVENFNEESLNVSVWTGDVVLKNLELRATLLDELDLPMRIKRGTISSLSLKIPWSSISSKPLEVHIDDVFLVVSMQSGINFDREKNIRRQAEMKLAEIQSIENYAKAKKAKAPEQQNAYLHRNSFWMRLLIKLLDNIQIEVNHIHMKVEDAISVPGKINEYGLVLQSLHVLTVDENGIAAARQQERTEKSQIIRKSIEATNVGLYLHTVLKTTDKLSMTEAEVFSQRMKDVFRVSSEIKEQRYLIHPLCAQIRLVVNEAGKKGLMSKPDFNQRVMGRLGIKWQKQCIDAIGDTLWEELVKKMPPRVNGQTWTLTYLFTETWSMAHYNSEDDGAPSLDRYIEALKMCLQWGPVLTEPLRKVICSFYQCAKWVYEEAIPTFEAKMTVDTFRFELRRSHFSALLGSISTMQKILARTKYADLRPALSITANPGDWWKYAISAVTRDIREARKKLSWSSMMQFHSRKLRYIELYKTKQAVSALTLDEAQEVTSLEAILEATDIVYFRQLALTQLEADKTIKSTQGAEVSSGNWFTQWWYGTNDSRPSKGEDQAMPDTLTMEDRKQLYAAIEYDPAEDTRSIVGRTDVFLSISCHLQSASFSLLDDCRRVGTKPRDELVQILVDKLAISSYSRKSGFEVATSLNNLIIDDYSCRLGKSLRIVNRMSLEDIKAIHPDSGLAALRLAGCEDPLPFIQATFEAPPPNGGTSIATTLYVQPLDVAVSIPLLARIAGFFTPPPTVEIDLSAAKNAAFSRVKELRELSTAQLREIVSRHKTLTLDMHIAGPTIRFLEDIQNQGKDSIMLVINIGRLTAESCCSPTNSLAHYQGNMSSEDPVEFLTSASLHGKLTADELYDSIFFVGRGFTTHIGQQAQFQYKAEPSTTFQFQPVSIAYERTIVLDQIGLDIELKTSIVPDNTEMPMAKLSGKLTPVKFYASAQKVKNITKLVKCLEAIYWKELEKINEDSSSMQRQTWKLAEANEHESLHRKLSVSSSSSFPSETPPDSVGSWRHARIRSKPEKHKERPNKEPSTNQMTLSDEELRSLAKFVTLHAMFNVPDVQVVLSAEESEESAIAKLSVKDLNFTIEQRLYRSDGSIMLQSLTIEDKMRERVPSEQSDGQRTKDRHLFKSGVLWNKDLKEDGTCERALVLLTFTAISNVSPMCLNQVDNDDITRCAELKPLRGCTNVSIEFDALTMGLNRDTIATLFATFITQQESGLSARRERHETSRGKRSFNITRTSTRNPDLYSQRSRDVTPSSRVSRSSSASSTSSFYGNDGELWGSRRLKSISENLGQTPTLQLKLRVRSFDVVLNSESGEGVARLGVEELSLELTVNPRKTIVAGTLLKFIVQDLTPAGATYPYVIFSNAHNKPEHLTSEETGARNVTRRPSQTPRMLEYRLVFWVPFDNQTWHPGYQVSFNATFRSLRAVFLHRFVDEIVSWGTTGPMVEALAEFQQTKSSVQANISVSNAITYHELPVLTLPKLDVSLVDISVELPRDSYSPEMLSLRIEELLLANLSSLPAGPISQLRSSATSPTLDDEFYDTLDDPANVIAARALSELEIQILGSKLLSVLLVRSTRSSDKISSDRWISSGNQLQEQSVMGAVNISIKINVDQHLSVAVKTSQLPFICSQLQYGALLGESSLLATNFAEKATIILRRTFNELPLKEEIEVQKQNTGAKSNLTDVEVSEQQTVGQTRLVMVDIPSVLLDLLAWDYEFIQTATDAPLGSEPLYSPTLARLRLDDLSFSQEVSMKGVTFVEMGMRNISVEDTRTGTNSDQRYKTLLKIPQNENVNSLADGKSSQWSKGAAVSLTLISKKQSEESEVSGVEKSAFTTDITLQVGCIDVIASDLLFVLLDYYTNPMPPSDDNGIVLHSNATQLPPKAQEPVAPMSSSSLNVAFAIESLSLYLVKDSSTHDSMCMVLRLSSSGSFVAAESKLQHLSLDLKKVRCTGSSNLTLGDLPGPTIPDALSPCNLHVLLCRRPSDGNLDLVIISDDKLNIRIGYVDAQTVKAGLDSLFAPSSNLIFRHLVQPIPSSVAVKTKQPIRYGKTRFRLVCRTTYKELWTSEYNYGYGAVSHYQHPADGAKRFAVIPPVQVGYAKFLADAHFVALPTNAGDHEGVVRLGEPIFLSNGESQIFGSSDGFLGMGFGAPLQTVLWRDLGRGSRTSYGIVHDMDTVMLEGITNYQYQECLGGFLMCNGLGNAPIQFRIEVISEEEDGIANGSSEPLTPSPVCTTVVSIGAQVTFSGVRILLVNDANNMQLPLIYVCLNGMRFMYGTLPDNRQSLMIVSEIEMQNYNTSAAAWEPLLENVIIGLARHINGGLVSIRDISTLDSLEYNLLDAVQLGALKFLHEVEDRGLQSCKLLLQDIQGARELADDEAHPESAIFVSADGDVELNLTPAFLNMCLDTFRDLGTKSVHNSMGSRLYLHNLLGLDIEYSFEESCSHAHIGKKVEGSSDNHKTNWIHVSPDKLMETQASAHTFPLGSWSPTPRRKIWIRRASNTLHHSKCDFGTVQLIIDYHGSKVVPVVVSRNRRLYIVCELVPQGGTRVLRLRTNSRVRNDSGIPITLNTPNGERSYDVPGKNEQTTGYNCGVEEFKSIDETQEDPKGSIASQQGIVKPGGVYFLGIPDLAAGLLDITPMLPQAWACATIQIPSNPQNRYGFQSLVSCKSTESSIALAIHLEAESAVNEDQIFVLTSPIILENQLPLVVEYRLNFVDCSRIRQDGEGSTIVPFAKRPSSAPGCLFPGEQAKISHYDLELLQTVFLAIRLRKHSNADDFSDNIRIYGPGVRGGDTLLSAAPVMIKIETQATGKSTQEFGSLVPIRCIICASHWLVNDCPWPLQFLTSASPEMLRTDPKRPDELHISNVALLSVLNPTKEDWARVCIFSAGAESDSLSLWSSPVNISTVGLQDVIDVCPDSALMRRCEEAYRTMLLQGSTSASVSILESLCEGKPLRSLRCVQLSISSDYAVFKFSQTKVLNFAPTVSIVNQSRTAIMFVQQGVPDDFAETISAGSSAALVWPVAGFPKRLRLKSVISTTEKDCSGSGMTWTSWSGVFGIERSGVFVLKCRAENSVSGSVTNGVHHPSDSASRRTICIKVRVVFYQSSRSLILSDCDISESPYIIKNDCVLYGLRIWQKGTRIAPDNILPLTSTPYTWDDWTPGAKLTIQVYKLQAISLAAATQKGNSTKMIAPEIVDTFEMSLDKSLPYTDTSTWNQRGGKSYLQDVIAASKSSIAQAKIFAEVKIQGHAIELSIGDRPKSDSNCEDHALRRMLLGSYKIISKGLSLLTEVSQQLLSDAKDNESSSSSDHGSMKLWLQVISAENMSRTVGGGILTKPNAFQLLTEHSDRRARLRARVEYQGKVHSTSRARDLFYPNWASDPRSEIVLDIKDPSSSSSKILLSLVLDRQGPSTVLSSCTFRTSDIFAPDTVFEKWLPLFNRDAVYCGNIHLRLILSHKIGGVIRSCKLWELQSAIDATRETLSRLLPKMDAHGVSLPRHTIPANPENAASDDWTDKEKGSQRQTEGSVSSETTVEEEFQQRDKLQLVVVVVEGNKLSFDSTNHGGKLYAALTFGGETFVTDSVKLRPTIKPSQHLQTNHTDSSEFQRDRVVEKEFQCGRRLGIDFSKIYNMAVVKAVHGDGQAADIMDVLSGMVLVAIGDQDVSNLPYLLVTRKLESLFADGEEKVDGSIETAILRFKDPDIASLSHRESNSMMDETQTNEYIGGAVWNRRLILSKSFDGRLTEDDQGPNILTIELFRQSESVPQSEGTQMDGSQQDQVLPVLYFFGEEPTMANMDSSRFGRNDALLGRTAISLASFAEREEPELEITVALFSHDVDQGLVRVCGNIRLALFIESQVPEADVRVLSYIRVEIPRIGISMVSGGQFPKELLYLSLSPRGISQDRTGFRYSRALISNGTVHDEVEAGHLQIDNQLQHTIYPVMLYPVYQNYEDVPTLQIVAVTSSLGEVSLLHFGYLFLNPLEVRVDDLLLAELLGFLGNIQWSNEEKPLSSGDSEAKLPTDILQKWQNERAEAQAGLKSQPDVRWLIEWLHIFPIKMNITFTTTNDQALGSIILPTGSGVVLRTVVNAAANFLSNIDRAPIELHETHLENEFDSYLALRAKLWSRYREMGLRGIYRLMGSVDVLGNPLGLVDTLQGGVQDFFFTPAKMLFDEESGLLQVNNVPRGFLHGSRSLFRATTVGLLHTTGKIAETLGKGVTVLSMDKKYYLRHRKAMRAPRNIRESFIGAGTGLFCGIWEGAKGCVIDPWRGAHNGCEGFIHGVGTGLAGLFAKPAAGIFQMTSYTMQGLRTMIEPRDLTGTVGRVRAPRYFSKDGLLFPYSKREAAGCALVYSLAFAGEETYLYHLGLHGDRANAALILTNVRLIVLNLSRNTIEWTVDIDRRIEVEHADEKLTLTQYTSQHPRGMMYQFYCQSQLTARLMTSAIEYSIARFEPMIMRWNIVKQERRLASGLLLDNVDDAIMDMPDYEMIRQNLLESFASQDIFKWHISSAEVDLCYTHKPSSSDQSPVRKRMIDRFKSFTVYVITVAGGVYQWKILRRYSDFDDLVSRLKSCGFTGLKLPSSKVLSTQSIVEKKATLTSFLSTIVLDDHVNDHKIVREFLTRGAVEISYARPYTTRSYKT